MMRQRLCAAILLMEAVILGLVTPALLATHATSTATAVGLGLGLCALAIVTAGMLRMHWAYWVGWAIQFATISLGFVIGAMVILGIVFLGLWVSAFQLGGMIDRERAATLTDTV